MGLDIGSNTFSCVELKRENNSIEIVRDMSIPVRLSEGLTDGGCLKTIAVGRSLFALEKIVKRFAIKEKKLRVVGTAVLRMAKNPEVFMEPAAEIIGTNVEVITGEEEALLVGRSAAFGIDTDGPITSVDVGGQSTEICSFDGDGHPYPVSLPMGVVSLTGQYINSDPPTAGELSALRQKVLGVLRDGLNKDLGGNIIGVAGTATALGRIELGIGKWSREKIHGLQLSRSSINKWIEEIVSLTANERVSQLGVQPMRADVFPAGLLVLDSLLEFFARDSLTISANGLRFGAALELLEA